MNRVEKQEWSKEFVGKLTKAKVAIFADYKGLKAGEADDLRRKLRGHDVEVQVIKNNIARLAVKDGVAGEDAKSLMDGVVGPTLVAFAYGDPAAAAKVFAQFTKEHEALKLKPSMLGAQKIAASEVEQLASLPSKEVLLSTFLSALNGPARSFVSVLAAVPRGLVTVLSAIEKKKSESQGGAAPT